MRRKGPVGRVQRDGRRRGVLQVRRLGQKARMRQQPRVVRREADRLARRRLQEVPAKVAEPVAHDVPLLLPAVVRQSEGVAEFVGRRAEAVLDELEARRVRPAGPERHAAGDGRGVGQQAQLLVDGRGAERVAQNPGREEARPAARREPAPQRHPAAPFVPRGAVVVRLGKDDEQVLGRAAEDGLHLRKHGSPLLHECELRVAVVMGRRVLGADEMDGGPAVGVERNIQAARRVAVRMQVAAVEVGHERHKDGDLLAPGPRGLAVGRNEVGQVDLVGPAEVLKRLRRPRGGRRRGGRGRGPGRGSGRRRRSEGGHRQGERGQGGDGAPTSGPPAAIAVSPLLFMSHGAFRVGSARCARPRRVNSALRLKGRAHIALPFERLPPLPRRARRVYATFA